jgi:hypothetical protein
MRLCELALHHGVVTWKRVLLALGLALVVFIVATGWWAYRWFRPNKIEIQNNGSSILRMWAEPTDLCDRLDISPGDASSYQDDWLCRKPILRFTSPTIGEITCDWDVARDNQPVIVSDNSVSCYPERILTPIVRDLFPPPSPTPLVPGP